MTEKPDTASFRWPDPLPVTGTRDVVNRLRADAKFRWPPKRAYYRYRARKKAHRNNPELNLIPYLVRRGSVALDIGANLGLVTHFLAPRAGHVYAFEPNPEPLRILPSVVARNVTVLPIAVSDRSGTANLQISRSASGWTSNGATLETAARAPFELTVDVRRIDDLDVGDVSFIKVDVEGHEQAVLAGARETIARCRPVVMLEVERSHLGDAASENLRRLSDLGYRTYALIDGALTSAGRFSFEAHQDMSKRGTPAYVQNFFFLPE